MTDNKKTGEQISENEYIEAFVTEPNTVTVQIRVDKGDYWVLSRQTFLTKDNLTVNSDLEYSSLSYIRINDDNLLDQSIFNQIDNTRYIINNDF